MKRIEWSAALGARIGNAPSARAIAEVSLGPTASADTLRAIANASSGAQALALLLMSPEFQRR
jgi:uncharacterized protein (DUF1800 family)